MGSMGICHFYDIFNIGNCLSSCYTNDDSASLAILPRDGAIDKIDSGEEVGVEVFFHYYCNYCYIYGY